jgi:hypothetical protein
VSGIAGPRLDVPAEGVPIFISVAELGTASAHVYVKLVVRAPVGASICRVLAPDPAGQLTAPLNPPGHVKVPPLLVHRLATPCLPGPAETRSEPAAANGLAIVTAVGVLHGAPASTIFPALLNCAQFPLVVLPPPNSKFDPRSVHVFVLVQPYRFCPAGADTLKNVAPVEQVAGRVVPV